MTTEIQVLPEQPKYEQLLDRRYLDREATLALHSGDGTITKEKQAFIDRQEELMKKLEEMLKEHTYHFSTLRRFKVYEPKERVIDVPNFYPDRIIERAATDLIKPLIIESLVTNTYGSIKGRGLHGCAAAIQAAIADGRGHWYFVKVDARHYYESIDHTRLKRLVRDLVEDDELYELIAAIIDAHDKGLAIGVYPSQYLANLYLSIVDWAMMEGYGFRFYFRYMDDIVILVPTKEEAQRALAILKDLFKMIHLTMKSNERIAPISYGIDFCGYVFYPTHTRLRKSIKEHAQRKARELDKAGVSDAEWAQQMASYYGWFKHANCANLWLSLVKNRHIHYKSKDKMKSLAEIKKSAPGEFGLPKDNFVSVLDIINTELEFKEVKDCKPFKEDNHGRYQTDGREREKRVAVRFSYPGEETEHYTITGSESLVDRLNEVKHEMPFTARIVTRVSARRKEYYAIE